ncbi:hypothetical protein [Streptomyces agglomeratus]|uniref:hypothetical protein n=1 Tax=Streptomyces agglomeratus TaxID=285458 RepID=UPI0026A0E74D
MPSAPTRRDRPTPFRLRPAALIAAGACALGLLAGPARADGQRPDERGDRELRAALEGLVRAPEGPPGAIALLQRART